MSKKIFLAMLFVFLIMPVFLFAQDYIYGDYLLSASSKRVSLDLENANFNDVLKMLSQQSGFNFVSSEAVRDRQLTLYLDKVPLKEAMDMIFKANSLTYEYYPNANIFIVKEVGKPTIELKTKVYKLKYVRVSESKMEKEIDSQLGPEDDEDDEDDEYDEFGKTIRAAVAQVLTEFGKVSEEPITNSLVVVDVPMQFEVIDQLIAALDKPLNKILIEVEMLDVSKRDIDEMGINWPDTLASLNVTGQRYTSFPFGNDNVSGTGSGKFTQSVLTVLGSELALNFLRTLTDTKSIARPKILTLENETAEIRITTDEAIGVTKDEYTDDSTTSYTIERAETGTVLRVTPQVDADTGEVTMFVEATVKEAIDSGFTLSADYYVEGTIKDPEERSAKTVARLKSGQTLMLGGLIKTERTLSQTKVPIFGDIPFVGRLFRWKSDDSQERELLIFLTPKLVNGTTSAVPANGAQRFLREQYLPNKQEAVSSTLDKFSYNN
ncbi:MAG: hypothetical protein WC214_04850 [Candidatus Omnitrophota bacterium]